MIHRERIVSLVVVSILFLGAISVFAPEKTECTAVTTLYVGGSGPGNYTTIQSAIDDASDGDTVFVYNGTYYETVVINKTINFFGEDRNSTIIEGENVYPDRAVVITSHRVRLSGFTTTTHGSYGAGIYLDSSSSNNVIMGNIITNNTRSGIYILHSSGNTITGNTITNNTNDGVALWGSSNNSILGNTITNNREGIDLYNSSSYNTISGNIITNNTDNGITLDNFCSNNTITGNTVTNSTYYDIWLYNSSGNTVTDNTITNSGDGIYLSYSSSNNTITGNTFTNNAWHGISLSFSSNNTITANTITHNNNGIYLTRSSNTNVITGNTVTNIIDYGIYLNSSSGNKIYHNNFINNSVYATIYYPGDNAWDNGYPSGGNYWDNYTGVDANGDNIGDTPYFILGGNNKDRYPLMMPYNLTINQLPTCTLSANPTSGVAPLMVTFTMTASDPDGAIITWKLDINNDGTPEYSGSGPTPGTKQHTYQTTGTYTAKLTVTDNKSATASAAIVIKVSVTPEENLPPIAGFTYSRDQLLVTFIDTSIDTDGLIDSWHWNFGDQHYSVSSNPTHEYEEAGVYTVNLTVTDDDGATHSFSSVIMVSEAPPENQPPVANFGYTPASSTIKANAPIEFMDASTDSDGEIVSWMWDFGDGSTEQGTQVTHTYAVKGTYTVTLTVTDDDGETDSSTRVITIESEEDDDGGIPGFEMIVVVIAVISILTVIRKRR